MKWIQRLSNVLTAPWGGFQVEARQQVPQNMSSRLSVTQQTRTGDAIWYFNEESVNLTASWNTRPSVSSVLLCDQEFTSPADVSGDDVIF